MKRNGVGSTSGMKASRHCLEGWRVLLPAAATVLVFISCSGGPVSKPLANRAPSIRIVRGQIVDDDTLTQVSQIDWIGWDDDGAIDHYQYAIDIPDSFDAQRIADPGTPGIDWKVTTETSGRFTFTTALPETSLGPDGTMTVTSRYLGHHSFHVRSVDDRGAVSRPDSVRFTVTNQIPRTTIETPKAAQYASVAGQVYISWSGRDPDKPTADLQPVAYEYKLIPIATVFSSSDPQYAVDVSPGPQYPWTRVPGSVHAVRLQLDPPQSYWFVIRAIDYLGAVENHFVTGVNAFKMESSLSNYDRPMLTVREASRGKHLFPDDGLTETYRIYADQCLRFEFSADLSAYGGILQGYNVGVDVADLDDFSPEGGFMGWTKIPTLEPICFRSPGFHTVSILCRDTGGGQTVAQYHITVLAVPVKDRDMLFVDDYTMRSIGFSTDATMDSRAANLVDAAGFSGQGSYLLEPWGPGDTFGSFKAPTREELGRYRLIIWQVEGATATGNARSALISSLGCSADKWLLAHVRSGGALWIYGDHALTGTKTFAGFQGNCTGSLLGNDPAYGLDLLPTDFLCGYMDICGGNFRTVQTDETKQHGMVAALPTDAAVADLMPRLEADSTTFPYRLLPALRYIDAPLGPILGSENLETLYTMVAIKTNSKFHGRPVAWRWADDDPVPEHGPVAFFSFSMHEVKQGSAADRTGALGVARSMGDWFRRYMVPPGSP